MRCRHCRHGCCRLGLACERARVANSSPGLNRVLSRTSLALRGGKGTQLRSRDTPVHYLAQQHSRMLQQHSRLLQGGRVEARPTSACATCGRGKGDDDGTVADEGGEVKARSRPGQLKTDDNSLRLDFDKFRGSRAGAPSAQADTRVADASALLVMAQTPPPMPSSSRAHRGTRQSPSPFRGAKSGGAQARGQLPHRPSKPSPSSPAPATGARVSPPSTRGSSAPPSARLPPSREVELRRILR